MATNYITIKGVIENGELKVELPENVQDGEVEVTIAVGKSEQPSTNETSHSDEEITGDESTEGRGPSLPHELQDISPGAVITRMMRTSIWDVYLQIMKDVRE